MKRSIMYLLIALTGLAPAGCAGMGNSSTPAGSSEKKGSAWESTSSGKGTNTDALRRDLMNFADRYTSSMVAAYDGLVGPATAADVRGLAVERKLNGVASAYVNATEPNAIVGLLDMLVMVRLTRESSEDAWFSEKFGAANSTALVAKLRVQEEDLWGLARRHVSGEQLTELGEVINRWRQEHPGEHYVSMVRVSDFPQAQATAAAKASKSVFGLLFLDPLAGLDPTLREVERSRELAERVFFYLQRMPILVSWRTEALSQQLLQGPEVRQLMKSLSDFATIASHFNESAAAITKLVERLPQQLGEERQRTVEDVAHRTTAERTAAVRQVSDAVAVERDAVLRQSETAIAKQRDEAVKQVAVAVTAEREAIVGELNVTLKSQREAFVSEMEAASGRVITRVFIYATVAVLLGVVLATAAALVVRHYTGRGTSSSRRQGHGKPLFG